jgi:hypothetical protein
MTDLTTLRDQFAAAALPALIAQHRVHVAWSEIAPEAYAIADDMLKARAAISDPLFDFKFVTALVLAAGGHIRVEPEHMLDADRYALVQEDGPASGAVHVYTSWEDK